MSGYGVLEREPPSRLRDAPVKPRAFGMTRDIWLMLLREGGHWSVSEISKVLKMDPRRVRTIVDNMHRSREVLRRNKAGHPKSRVRFGVSDACHVPQGVSVREIIGLARVKEE